MWMQMRMRISKSNIYILWMRILLLSTSTSKFLPLKVTASALFLSWKMVFHWYQVVPVEALGFELLGFPTMTGWIEVGR
jgi:hypothetical protein